VHEGFKEDSAHRVVAFFFESHVAAELDSCAAFGFTAGEAGLLEIVGAVLEVRAKFFIDFAVLCGAVEEAKERVEEVHISSRLGGNRGCWAIEIFVFSRNV